MRKRILLISNSDWFFVSHRLEIGLAAISKGYEVHLATKFIDKKNFLKEYGFILHPIEMHRSNISIFGLLKNLFDILKIINKVKPNLIHAITIKPVIIGGIASRIYKNTPFVAAISGLGFLFISKNFFSRTLKFLVKYLYKIAFSGKYIKVIFQNISDQKIVMEFCNLKKENIALINGSGVNLDYYKPLKNPSLSNKVLYASRLLKSKGIIEFAKSAENLKSSRYEFLIAGKFDTQNPDCISRKDIDNWQKKEIIKYLGHQNEVKNLIQQSRLVVLPSYYGEGFPKILIEAAACGVPVVTTDHPGCRDAIIPDVTGLLVPIKNSNELSKAISKLLDDNKLCERMSKSARELAEKKYDIKDVVNIHMKIYKELIDKEKKSLNY